MEDNTVQDSASKGSNTVAPAHSRGGSSYTSKTEAPYEPDHIHHAFERPVTDAAPVGNRAFELMLKMEGLTGHFLDREQCINPPTFVNMNPTNIRSSVFLTLKQVCSRLLRKKGFIEAADIEHRAVNLAGTLTHGVMIGFYLKLRNIAFPEPRINQRFLKVPKTPGKFTLPAPYALAISQLGVFKVSSLTKELVLVPTYASKTANFGLDPKTVWSSTGYVQAREHAEDLGLSFEKPDLDVKLGSSWWLYQEVTVADMYILRCPFPEDNFTEETAILRTLFSINDNGEFSNEICTLPEQEIDDYGSMLRDPPADVNVSTYFAFDKANSELWNVV